MKTTTLLIVLLCLKTSWGQIQYRPMPETDATWIQAQFLYSIGGHEHQTITTAVYITGDTVINGLTYVKIGSHGTYKWMDGFGTQNPSTGGGPIAHSTGYFRQDIVQKKVFIWNSPNQTDELLYDFGSLVIGQPYPETVTNYNYPNLLVMGQDSVQLMDGNYYKRWVLGTNSQDSAYVSVIEGVGGTSGFNTPIYPVFEQESHLLCHKVGTQQLYEDWRGNILPPEYSEDCSRTLALEQKDEIKLIIFPNPANSNVSIQSNGLIRSVEICNLNGQSLIRHENSNKDNELSLDLNNLKQGVYLARILSADGHTMMRQIQLIR